MWVHVRRKGTAWLATAAVAALAIGGPAASARAQVSDTITFDADGDALGNAPVDIGALDWLVGNAVGVGSVPITVGGTFTTYYQARLTGLIGPNNTGIPDPVGLDTAFEITVVARFLEVVVGPPATSGLTAAFKVVPDPDNFLKIYYDDLTDAMGLQSNDLLGTGFDDGQLILEANPLPDPTTIADSTFTVTGGTPALGSPPAIYDQFGANDYTGTFTVTGLGGTQFPSQVIFVDSDFFMSNLALFSTALNTDQNLPFNEQNPAMQFLGGDHAAVTPDIGTYNGGAAPTMVGGVLVTPGPDFQFEADGRSSFSVIPEPSTVSLGLMAAGLGSLVALRQRRRPTTASSAS